MSSAPDDHVIVTLDHGTASIVIDVPGADELVLPMAVFAHKAKVRADGTTELRLVLRADELHVHPAPEKQVTIDVPPPVTPEQAYEAQITAIQRQALGFDDG